MQYRLAVIIINYCSLELTLQCLDSLKSEIEIERDIVLVIDNASPDSSGKKIDEQIHERAWSEWAAVRYSPVNGGFSWGNNFGLQSVEADLYLLLNSDTMVRPQAFQQLLAAAEKFPAVGLISPRLEWPDASPQISCFKNHNLFSQMIDAAGTGPVTRLFQHFDVPVPIRDDSFEPQWTSFACVLLKKEMIQDVGLMDDDYFMYFEDNDYCRRIWMKQWRILHWPWARVVHLRGGSSSVKGAQAQRRRLPSYYYASRTRYFAKFMGRPGLLAANLLWSTGRLTAGARELCGKKAPHNCQSAFRDIWTNFLRPLQSPLEKRQLSGVNEKSEQKNLYENKT